MAGKPILTPIEIEVAKHARSLGVGPDTVGSWFGVSRDAIMWHTTPGYKEKRERSIAKYRQKHEHRRQRTAVR